MNDSANKRIVCPRCLRPQRTCICQWTTPTAHRVEVLILQHPLEAKQAKGSAPLLHLSLPNSRLVIGEVFDEQELEILLHAPLEAGVLRMAGMDIGKRDYMLHLLPRIRQV